MAVAAATLSLTGISSQAVAACWTQNAVEAAQVRGFETMLMVATLRCQIKGVDLTGDYNAFIRGKRAVLTGVNDELRARFAAQGLKGNAALDAYDRFVTSIANSYGSGIGAPSCGEFKMILESANALPASRAALLTLALETGTDPVRASERCGARIAMAN